MVFTFVVMADVKDCVLLVLFATLDFTPSRIPAESTQRDNT